MHDTLFRCIVIILSHWEIVTALNKFNVWKQNLSISIHCTCLTSLIFWWFLRQRLSKFRKAEVAPISSDLKQARHITVLSKNENCHSKFVEIHCLKHLSYNCCYRAYKVLPYIFTVWMLHVICDEDQSVRLHAGGSISLSLSLSLSLL